MGRVQHHSTSIKHGSTTGLLDPTWTDNLVLLFSFSLIVCGMIVKYLKYPSLHLEFIVVMFHISMCLLSKGRLRTTWKFSIGASILNFWPGDTCVTLMGLFRYLEPAIFYIGKIPSYMVFMWSITYILAMHIAYTVMPHGPVSPRIRAFLVIAVVYAVFEALEPYLKIWEWTDYHRHGDVPSIVPVVILYESLVGTGYTILYEQRRSIAGAALAFGLPFSVVCMYTISLSHSGSVSLFLRILQQAWVPLWASVVGCLWWSGKKPTSEGTILHKQAAAVSNICYIEIHNNC